MILRIIISAFVCFNVCAMDSDHPIQTRSETMRYRAKRDDYLNKKNIPVEQFNEEKKQRFYELSQRLAQRSYAAMRKDTEELLHAGVSSLIIGLLCFGIKECTQNACIDFLAHCSGCDCLILASCTCVLGCSSCNRAYRIRKEINEMPTEPR